MGKTASHDETNKIGQAMRLIRKERGLKQEDVAQALGEKQSMVSYIENGVYPPSARYIMKFAKTYNVSCDYLFGITNNISGKRISIDEIGMPKKPGHRLDNAALNSQEKLMWQSLKLIMDMLADGGSDEVIGEASLFMMLNVYRLFRIVYGANPKNRPELFRIDEKSCDLLTSGGINGVVAKLDRLLSRNKKLADELRFVSEKMTEKDPDAYLCLTSVIEQSETFIATGKAFERLFEE